MSYPQPPDQPKQPVLKQIATAAALPFLAAYIIGGQIWSKITGKPQNNPFQ